MQVFADRDTPHGLTCTLPSRSHLLRQSRIRCERAERCFAGRSWTHASLILVDGLSLLHPEEQVFEAMLEGFANQQLARNLAYSPMQSREHQLRAFAGRTEAFPWRWSSHLPDE